MLADSAASKSNSGRTEGAIRHLYNAFWNIDSFCIYQQGLTDIMHTWSLGILDYVIFSVFGNEMISYLRSFKLRKTSRLQGEASASAHWQAFSNAGCVKLREAPHSNSIWRVLPVRHILGQVPLAPLTYQTSKKPFWRHKDDVTEERMRLRGQ